MISKFAISKCSQIHLFFLLFIFRILVGRDVAYALSISKDQILMAIKRIYQIYCPINCIVGMVWFYTCNLRFVYLHAPLVVYINNYNTAR